MCQNLRSMHTGFKKLELLLEALPTVDKPDCIVCQEIYKPKGTFLLDDYQAPILKARETSNGGGVCIWLKKGHKFKVKESPFVENTFESLAVELTIGREKLHIVNFYRPPQSRIIDLLTYTEEILQSYENCIMLGDANLDYKRPSKNKSRLDDILVNYGYHQIVKNITRPSKNSTLIDHVYVPLHQNYHVSVHSNYISDHNSIKLELPTEISKKFPPPGPTEFYSYKKTYVDLVKKDLHTIDWPATFKDKTVNQCVGKLERVLSTSVNLHCLKKIKNVDKIRWLPRPLFNLKCRLTKKLNEWQKDTDNINKETSYKNLKKRFEAALLVAQNEREHILLSEKNPSKLWQNIRNITFNKKDGKESIRLDTSAGNEAEDFCDFFSNIANKIRDSLPKVDQDPLKYNIVYNTRFKFTKQTVYDIWKIISNSNPKRSFGHDRISSKIIKLLAYEIASPMHIIVNKIIECNIFPDTWKKSDVIPLFKKGNKGDIGNYRPISLLPCLSKIAEKVLVKQINQYFEINNLFPKTQYGFRTKKSTEHALLNLTYEVEQMKHRREEYAIILLDFSKAFDLIDHSILYKKLKCFGFCKKAIRLINSYLVNRSLRVQCNGKSSSYKEVSVGTPQGSCLGPLLYLIYTAEITNLLPEHKKIIFADDTALLLKFNAGENKTAKIKNTLEMLWRHFTASKLKLNMSKTEILTNCITGEIKLGDNNIKINNKTYTTKYLGVLINSQLNWNVHLQSVMQKMKFGLIQMYRIQTKNSKIRKNLYSTMVRSHLLYGLLSWGCNITKDQARRVNSLIKASARCIQSVKRKNHSAPLLKKSEILYLEDEIKVKSLTMALSLHDQANKNNELHRYWVLAQRGTRSGVQLQCKVKGQSILKHTKMFNQNQKYMALELKDKTKIEHLKTDLLKVYQITCNGISCYICGN